MSEKNLTPKQEAFCREYLIDLNGTQAAIRAGYSVKGAHVQAAQLLSNTKVSEYLQTLMEARSKRTEVDADWVLKRLAQDATADLADIYDENGNLKQVHEWPMAWRTGLIAGVETVTERDGEDENGKPEFSMVRKVKLSDRAKLLEMIGRHVGVQAFKDKVEHSGKIGLESLIAGDE
jgi:phage terminase small subunit